METLGILEKVALTWPTKSNDSWIFNVVHVFHSFAIHHVFSAHSLCMFCSLYHENLCPLPDMFHPLVFFLSDLQKKITLLQSQVCWRCVVSWRKVMWWLHLWQLNPCNNWLLNLGCNGFFTLLAAWASCGNLPGDFCKVVTSKAVAVIWMWREIRWPNIGLGNEIYTSSSHFFGEKIA